MSKIVDVARRARHSSVLVIGGAYLLAMAMAAEWSFLLHPELVQTEPAALVYRAGFAGALASVAFVWVAYLHIRLRRVERRLASPPLGGHPTNQAEETA